MSARPPDAPTKQGDRTDAVVSGGVAASGRSDRRSGNRGSSPCPAVSRKAPLDAGFLTARGPSLSGCRGKWCRQAHRPSDLATHRAIGDRADHNDHVGRTCCRETHSSHRQRLLVKGNVINELTGG
jgi:hypothetical protein